MAVENILFFSIWTLIISCIAAPFFPRSKIPSKYYFWACYGLITCAGLLMVAFLSRKAPDILEENMYTLTLGDDQGVIALGADPSNDIVLLNNHAERFHAEIRYSREGSNMIFRIMNVAHKRKVAINNRDMNKVAIYKGSTVGIGSEEFAVVKTGLTGITISNEGHETKIGPKGFLAPIPIFLLSLSSRIPLLNLFFAGTERKLGETRSADGVAACFSLRERNFLIYGKTFEDNADIYLREDGNRKYLKDRTSELKAGDAVVIGHTPYRFSCVGRTISLQALGRGYVFLLPKAGPGPTLLSIPDSQASDILVSKSRNDLKIRSDRSHIGFEKRGEGLVMGTNIKGEKEGSISYRQSFVINNGNSQTSLTYLSYSRKYMLRLTILIVILSFFFVLLYMKAGLVNDGNYQFLLTGYWLILVGAIIRFDLGTFSDNRIRDLVLPMGRSIKEIWIVSAILCSILFYFVVLSKILEAKDWRIRRMYRFVTSNVPLKYLSVLLLLFQIPFGERGISSLGVNVQPVEFVKTICVIYFAACTWEVAKVRQFLSDKLYRPGNDMSNRIIQKIVSFFKRIFSREFGFLRYSAVLMLIFLILFLIKDLSPILEIALFLLATYWITLNRGEHDLILLSLIFISLALIFSSDIMTMYREGSWGVVDRFRAWVSPYSTVSGTQFIQALWAVEDGGMFGTGLGTAEAVLIPEIQNDFILSFFLNRTGFCGACLLVLTYILFFAGGLRAYSHAGSWYHRESDEKNIRQLTILLALVIFGIQIATVLASVSGLAPVMGQSLPFMSVGNSQFLFFSVFLTGLIIFSSRKDKIQEDSQEGQI